MTLLSVNVNKIALLRNSRGPSAGPNVVEFSRAAVEAGAQGITIHPRADQRHIRPSDAQEIMRHIRSVEVNFEGDPREDFLEMVCDLRPTQCTLVPVVPGEITSHRGWDVARWKFLLGPVVAELKRHGVRTSLFVEPDPEPLAHVRDLGADRIEIYTGHYAQAFLKGNSAEELRAIAATVARAHDLGLGVNAGHDLTLENIPPLLGALAGRGAARGIHEFSIGHYLVVRALEVGFRTAVKDYRNAISEGLRAARV